MGNKITVENPYIIDEYYSDDDACYESAVESLDHSPVKQVTADEGLDKGDGHEESQKENRRRNPWGDRSGNKTSAELSKDNLDDLFKYLDRQDSSESRKPACVIKHSELVEQKDHVHQPQTAVSTHSSVATSSWKAESETDLSRAPIQSSSHEGDRRKVLAQLDKELNQFEAYEERIANNLPPSPSPSHIPRLTSAARTRSTSGGRSSSAGRSRDKSAEGRRQRGVSPGGPGGRSRSGIPRYGAIQHSPGSSSSMDSETELQSFIETQSESLPSVSETSEKVICKNCRKKESGLKTEEDKAAWDINISDMTGRAKKGKKRSGIPSMWIKQPEGASPTKSIPDAMQEGGVAVAANSEEVEILAQRKVLDLKRWCCISRPQYKTSCGISSVVSCWNYLFSTIGNGSLKPLTQEAAMKILGFQSPFEDIKFGSFTGNLTLLRWFRQLNAHFRVRGHCYYMFKPCGKNQTAGVTDEMALTDLKKGLKDPNTTFIYHCHNHYFCPIGYEDTPSFCVDAYNDVGDKNVDTWVLIGDTSRKHPAIHCKSWEDVCTDLHCKNPSFFNIRHSYKGIQQRESVKRRGGNLHCIMTFKKVSEKQPLSATSSQSSTSSRSQSGRSSRLPVRPSSSHAPALSDSASVDRCDFVWDEIPPNMEEEEVGVENLDSDCSDDWIDDEKEESSSLSGSANGQTRESENESSLPDKITNGQPVEFKDEDSNSFPGETINSQLVESTDKEDSSLQDESTDGQPTEFTDESSLPDSTANGQSFELQSESSLADENTNGQQSVA